MKVSGIQPFNSINTKTYSNARCYTQKTPTGYFSNVVLSNNNPAVYFKGVNTSFAIDKLNEFSVKEYKKLSPDFIRKLRQECSQILYSSKMQDKTKDIEAKHEIASNFIINALDSQYGKDNWVIISLGRSVSSILKVIGYKIGEERAKQLPMTRANRFIDEKSIKALEGTEDLEVLKKYLDSIGLNKKNIAESNKHYVLTDYCYSGGSLLGGYKLLTSDLLLGNTPKIHKVDVMSVIPLQFDEYFYHGKFKEYSEVKQCRDLKETANSLCDISSLSRESKLMRFKLLDNVMKNYN